MPQYSVQEEIDALVDAGLLTERQARAWVLREIELTPIRAVAQKMDVAESTVSGHVSTAQRRIDEARATVEAADAIRDQVPDECSECGGALGGRWATDGAGQPLCFDCAGLR